MARSRLPANDIDGPSLLFQQQQWTIAVVWPDRTAGLTGAGRLMGRPGRGGRTVSGLKWVMGRRDAG